MTSSTDSNTFLLALPSQIAGTTPTVDDVRRHYC